ncbi:MAG: hypothetical protein J6S21_06570, partial [Victivallales bacterium]|nr:hypothetical protein [Victivallales bacterium]
MSTQPPGAALRNIASLRKFNLYTSLALTVVSSLIFMDLLMLRMDIDTRLFGSIKSMLYLLPAIAYQCMTPVLNRVRNDAKVCAWCYLLRCFIPSILPLLALVTANHAVLTVACFLLPSVGMMLAGFANNTLMILYKRFIPEHDFNRQVGIYIPAVFVRSGGGHICGFAISVQGKRDLGFHSIGAQTVPYLA